MSDSAVAWAACDSCVRRAALLERLAPLIERVATRQPGRRARELLALSDDDLARALAGSRAEGALDRARGAVAPPDRLRAVARSAGLWSGCPHAGPYPARLRDLGGQMPAALFGRGDPGLLAGLDSEPAVTLVGARRASAYGRTVAGDLGRLLAAAGVTVVSGLAHGVDSAAHAGALEGHGGTIAVLGAGADRPYPAGQHRLYERIAARGLVLSELPPGARPYRWTFPARNRIMAALGAMTVVVEAASRSGSLITAEMSLDLGRELGAVPGPVNAWRHEGANQLLAEGARLVRGAQDALDVLYGPGVRRVVERGPELSSRTAAVLGQIEVGASSCDAIATALGAPAGEVGAALTQLELFGYLSSDALGRYLRTALRAPEPPRDRSGDSRGAAGASLAAKRH